jgi:hypothetical protein
VSTVSGLGRFFFDLDLGINADQLRADFISPFSEPRQEHFMSRPISPSTSYSVLFTDEFEWQVVERD